MCRATCDVVVYVLFPCVMCMQGVYVTFIYEGGPAHHAGLNVHDKLLQVIIHHGSDSVAMLYSQIDYKFSSLHTATSNASVVKSR